ncbi:hypothetical protein ACFV98_42595, partial [Streptomyces violascens]|uniref:hypothetical protein n=1 Tax=Streptomyces violascens TaxID=67381 RepID=UPI00364DCC6A
MRGSIRLRLRAVGGWARSFPRPWQHWLRQGVPPARQVNTDRSSPLSACPAIEDERPSGADGGAGG